MFYRISYKCNLSFVYNKKNIFLDTQRTHGAILLHILGAAYFFTLLAVVCNDYFLPSVECICEDLNISKV